MSKRFLPATLALLTLAACETGAPPPPSPYYRPPTAAEQSCVDRGYQRGTEAYDSCVTQASGVPRALPPPAVTPPAGVETNRDEYGFRYDGQGNRLDRFGNIVSPQSTQP